MLATSGRPVAPGSHVSLSTSCVGDRRSTCGRFLCATRCAQGAAPLDDSVLIPKPFAKVLALYKRAAFEELARLLHPAEADELGWFFKERARASETAA